MFNAFFYRKSNNNKMTNIVLLILLHVFYPFQRICHEAMARDCRRNAREMENFQQFFFLSWTPWS